MAVHALRAVIYIAAYLVGDQELIRWQGLCVEYCRQRGYELVALVTDVRAGRQWADVLRVVHGEVDGGAEVIVVPDRSHLPPERVPRIEAVAEERRRMGRPRFLGGQR